MNTFNDDIARLLKIRPETDAEAREYEARMKQQAMDKFHEACGMNNKFFNASLSSEKYSDSQKKALREYVELLKAGKSGFLVLLGDVGLGKTYTACAIMNELLYGTYIDMPELRLKLNTADRYGANENRETFLHRLAGCRLLVLDEIGRFPGKKDDEQEVLFYLLNKRYENDRPTILCSNFGISDFADFIGAALTDRLKGCNTKIIFDGESLRGRE
jgi:DNA replication protein DnaC